MMSEEEIKQLFEVSNIIIEEGLDDEDDIQLILKKWIDLYNKEKANNIELKVLIENNLKYSHKLEQDLFENASNYVISKNKIKALKEKVEKEMISNPYDFSYMINELLEE